MKLDDNENLQRKSTQFWKQISNGLRTPLNVIRGTADIAQNEIYDIETVKDGFQKIGESSEFLLSVVNEIVDFVTIENDELEISHQPFNLNTMMTQFIKKYFNKAMSQNKHLDAQIHAVLHEELIGDEHRVEQILDCMLINTLKYSNEGDNLCLEIFETGVSENTVSVRFTMTGTNRKMYDFLTGTVNGKVVTEATDLALYNSYYILLKMGGSIRVELDENNNSKIVIDMNFGLPETDTINHTLFENEKILIICDDRKEAEIRGELLLEMKASYSTAIDSEEALEMIGEADEAKQPYSACVVDWNVKNFIIQDFVNDVRTIFGNEMPLIAMAYNTDQIKEQALKMGFNHVMNHTWFRSTICDVLMKNTQGLWKSQNEEEKKKRFDFRNRHILVAEDSELNMEFIVHVLTNAHADVICATNGMEAYNLFIQKPEHYFDCILMDVNMPEMDGYETTKNIRKVDRKDATTIPIFALTANAFQSDIKEALSAGMNGHFSKPVDVNRMYEVLEDLFEKTNERMDDKQSEMGKIMEAMDIHREKDQETRDLQTGLLSLHGLETQLVSHQYINHPVGFLLIEIENYNKFVDLKGRDAAEQLACCVSDKIKEAFRTSDVIARYSDSCFAIVLNHCDNGIDFVEDKIQRINEEINKDNADLIKVCCGASYSENGYSNNMTSLSFDALSHAKESGKDYYNVVNQESLLNRINPANLLNENIHGMEMIYLKGKQITEVNHLEELISILLGKNQAVGVMCGTFEEGFPICSANKFALDNFGYESSSFMQETDSLLINTIHQDDNKTLKDYMFGHDLEIKKLRFKHKSGNNLWFNVAYITTITSKGEKLWIASLRPNDENIVGDLCSMDYEVVSLLYPEEKIIIIEKGNELIYTEELKLRKKYNYESLLKNVFAQMHKDGNKEEFLHQMNIETILLQLEQMGIYEFIAYQTKANGENIPIRYKFRYLDNDKKKILLTLEYVENLAESDDVTSLLNENGFYRSVKNILNQKENEDKKYVLLYTNIKDFKSCNEILGYSDGNELLRLFADFMEKSQLHPVCCARFHADRFCFLVEKQNFDLSKDSIIFNRKITINGKTMNVRILAGIYEIDEKEQDVSIMCDKAVLAAESITNEYATPYYVFDEKVNDTYKNRIFVLNNLDRAFERDEFQVYYQPVCDVKTGRVCSAEALIRWIMPGGKIVSPGVFVPVLESKGFISRLDLLVANKVQKFTEERVHEGKEAVPVSINLSRMDFLNDTFLEELQQQIDEIQVEKSLFRYEITESAYINVGEDGENFVDELRNKKSQIYIDDFGTGYSSLQNLMEIYFDVLKLDMYFIRRIGSNRIAEGIIDSTIRLCHSLGRKVIAEGVETEEQYQFLAERDCDYIQGYYFHKPMPANEFAALLDKEATSIDINGDNVD